MKVKPRRFWSQVGSHKIKLLIGVLVSGIFLYLVLRGINQAEIWQALRSADPVPLILAGGFGITANLIRTVRWRVLLGGDVSTPLRPLFTSMMIGYLANNLLPARAGELVRIYVLERKTGISKSLSAATVILERLTDVVMLVALAWLVSPLLPLPPFLQQGSWIVTGVCVAATSLLLLLALGGKRLMPPVLRILNVLPHHLRQRAQISLERFVQGLSALRSGKQLLLILGLTLGIWGAEAASVGSVMQALHLSVTWTAWLFVLVALSLSFVVPAAPGAVGTYEFFVVSALKPFAVAHNQAVVLAFVLHAYTYLIASAQGLICLWVEGVSLRDLAGQPPKP